METTAALVWIVLGTRQIDSIAKFKTMEDCNAAKTQVIEIFHERGTKKMKDQLSSVQIVCLKNLIVE